MGLNHEDNQEKIVVLRPHHIELFAEYYLNGRFYRNLIVRKYNKEFTNSIKDLWDYIIFRQDSTKVMIMSGLDEVCDRCPIRKEYCQNPDNLSVWNGVGIIMSLTRLRIGRAYSLEDFLRRVRKIYPYKTPISQPI